MKNLLYETGIAENSYDQIINFLNLKTMQINVLKEGRVLEQSIKDIERKFLKNLAKSDRGLGGYQARSILNFLGANYFIDPVFPEIIEVRNEKAKLDIPEIKDGQIVHSEIFIVLH